MRRLPVLIAFAALTMLAIPAVVAAADPTPVPVVDATPVPPTGPTVAPVVDPTPVPVVDPTQEPVVGPSSKPVESPAEPPVDCAPDATDCIGSGPIVLPMPASCPTGVEVCIMGGEVPGGPGASHLPLLAPIPAGGMLFSITTISDGTTSYNVQGSLTLGADGLSATVGCNMIAAPATWDAAGVLTITGPVVSTKMACMGDPGAAESLLVQLLRAGTVKWDGTALTGGGVTAEAMVAMADGVAPIYLSPNNGAGVDSGTVTVGTESSPVAAASGAADAASMALVLTAAAMVAFLLVGGLVARRASRASQQS
jgi:heat shock protein HslJ